MRIPKISSLKIEQIKEEGKWAIRSALVIGLNLTVVAVVTGYQKLYLPETYIQYANQYPRLATLQIFMIGYPILRTMLIRTKYEVLGDD